MTPDPTLAPSTHGSRETILAGRYRLGALLGRGGMAEVYRARDVVLGRPVAVKIFRRDPAMPDEAIRQRAEVRILASLSHPHWLHQALANLLSNARTHTPAGTTVAAQIIQHLPASEVEIRVEDDGPGIAPHAVPHIFERFMRADTARSHTTGNTGLGLPITEAIVHAHRGTIAVTSQPGRTTFTVRLPGSSGQHAEGSTL